VGRATYVSCRSGLYPRAYVLSIVHGLERAENGADVSSDRICRRKHLIGRRQSATI
jgi:hypothetical protein